MTDTSSSTAGPSRGGAARSGPVAPAGPGFLERAQSVVFTRVMSLPQPTRVRLAGRPVVREGNTLSTQTQLMLRLMKVSREKPVESLPMAQGRAALTRQCVMIGGEQPIGSVEPLEVAGAAGALAARLYVPEALVGASEPSPLTVFFHGGGMIYGDLDSHDAMCRFIAEEAQTRVVSVDYRLAPEHPFPAGVDDAWAAFCDVQDRAASLGGDPERMAVAGDSAGGYLSAATALEAARAGRSLAFQLLIYPMTDVSASYPSRRAFGAGFYLTTAFMDLATESYAADPADPRASVLVADVPPGLAPAFVCTAGFDPLRDEGEAYAAKLAEAGVPVVAERYAGQIHGFANMVGPEGEARRCMRHTVGHLRRALHP